ncbi:beta-galactosidase [Dinoroseobacter sp. S124A]|uniref:beta-galactosidase n=1 Tax=Dinoroseobacter sp. S124A TaxID=3415128 RepID=UPI003C7CADB0
MSRKLGVCYYPEHWPEDQWPRDAARMKAAGLTLVRIGEFAWSRLEPSPGDLQFDWLDRAVAVLAEAGLEVVMGTPTATPPRWMLDKHPDMLAHDAEGRPRGFGSRRHYCFAHLGYRAEAARIARIMGERYGRDPRVVAWQIDNEYGCHDTTLSYSPAARDGFRDWLAQRYQSTEALNRAWGNVFWSMDYDSFDQIELPNLTVTEPNPSHAMAFRRFASDMVVAFNRAQVEALRTLTDAPLIHNYMGRVTEFDHHDLGADLEIASWDSYPMGFLMDRVEGDAAHKATYLRQGDPDFQAFHHDLYRGVGQDGRWWIMEQQPGPVNWAPWNPAPLPGMVRLWSHEAFAHGAEAVCYFRWRQAPFAQEQMHAGLLRADDAEALGLVEARQVAEEIAALPEARMSRAPVALVFNYPSQWAWEVQPQGADFDYFSLCFEMYRGLRKLGLSVDILPADPARLSGYDLILVPGLLNLSAEMTAFLAETPAQVLVGPRAGSKTPELTMALPLGPGLNGLEATVTHVESLPPGAGRALTGGGQAERWIEAIESPIPPRITTEDGAPVLLSADRQSYLAAWPDPEALSRILRDLCAQAGINTTEMPEGVRQRAMGPHRLVVNYSPETRIFEDDHLPPAGLLWKLAS